MRLVLRCAALLLLVGCLNTGAPFLSVELPAVWTAESESPRIPAGDSLVLGAAKVAKRHPFWIEYPYLVELAPAVRGVQWQVTRGADVASVDARGMVRARRPGDAVVAGRAHPDLRGMRELRVVWPLDSITFRFATPEVAVGDTVELRFVRHYATGEAASRGAKVWVVRARLDPDHPEDSLQYASMGGVAREIAVEPQDLLDPRISETVAFLAVTPGDLAVRAWVHGRALRTTLRVVPAGARAPRFVRAATAPATRPRDRRPVGCWALAYGAWRSHSHARSDEGAPTPEQQVAAFAAFLPRAVELDATPVIGWAPEAGLRVNAVGDARIEVERWWVPAAPGRDSLHMHVHSWDDGRGVIRARFNLARDGAGLVGMVTARSEVAMVRGEPVTCDP